MKSTTISIIGTSGRNKEIPILKSHFEWIYEMVNDFINNHIELSSSKQKITLISGGASLTDHVAVELYLNDPIKYDLLLYLPCPIIEIERNIYRYYDSGQKDWRVNPGKNSNEYHFSFSKILGRDSINDIIKAKELGATLDTSSNSFESRNSKVAKSDYILAFTFSNTDKPEQGGTLDTWNKSNSINKYHFTIPH